MVKKWFEEWFDTDYYRELYKQRDGEEADRFVDQLVKHLQLKSGMRILDVACGRGRHSFVLRQLGFDVTGIDLSDLKIAECLEHEDPYLNFYKHDMRRTFRINYFDCVFNFFTSFGYFDSIRDDAKAAQSMASNLKPNGVLVIDYLNANHALLNLQNREELNTEDYQFRIRRSKKNGMINKEIECKDGSLRLMFYEQVRLYSLKDMVNLFERFGLILEEQFGSYELDPYDELQSDRMILIFHKKTK